MSATLNQRKRRIDWLAVFAERCDARAILVAHGDMSLIEAVDGLQASAVETGLVQTLGQDAVQAIMARYFSRAP
jgi:hypothetical protein